MHLLLLLSWFSLLFLQPTVRIARHNGDRGLPSLTSDDNRNEINLVLMISTYPAKMLMTRSYYVYLPVSSDSFQPKSNVLPSSEDFIRHLN